MRENGYDCTLEDLSELRRVAYVFRQSTRRSDISWDLHAESGTPEMLQAIMGSIPKGTSLTKSYGARSAPCASSQASATCAGVAPASAATALTSSTMCRLRLKFSPVKRGLVLRQSPSESYSAERISPVRKPWPSGE